MQTEPKYITMPLKKRSNIAGRHKIACALPAKEECHALVTGNGTLLVTDHGNPARDVLTIRQEELMSPQWPIPPKAPLIRDYLPLIRKKILEGRYEEAGEIADRTAVQCGTSPRLQGNPSHPAICLHIDQRVKQADDYLHVLDMRTSLITTRWTDGGEFCREVFCSRTDQIMALRFTAPNSGLNLTLRGDLPEIVYTKEKMTTNDLPGEGDGYFDCLAVFPRVSVTHTPDSILLTGSYAFRIGGFVTAARIVTVSGSTLADQQGIHIKQADSVLVLLGCDLIKTEIENRTGNALCHIPENDLKAAADRLFLRLKQLPADFDALLERHISVHQPLFDRLSVELGGESGDYLLTTSELKEKQLLSDKIIPAYMEAMVDMGRFFLLSECGKFPPIYGHVNININHQISGGNIGNLPEMMESFFRWIERQLPDARENASRILGTRGFFIACHPDQESGNLIHFNRCWPHHYWISSSGWCLQPFLEHYYCTGDEKFLKERLLPLYKELALLYEDFLSVRDRQGKLMFIPSYSPENFPENIPSMLNINAVMDISVCRQVFDVLLTLGIEAGCVSQEEQLRWRTLVSELPEYLVDTHGELKEWAWPEYEERYDHRHASHLYGVYPGDEIQPEFDAKLYHAVFISNRMRAIGNGSCHGIMHRAQAAARLKDNWLVARLLSYTLESGYVTDAFTTVHNPYRKHAFPDGQGALPTVLLESLLYSRPGFLEVLPALPSGSFHRGKLTGMASRSFAAIDCLEWDLEKGYIHLTFTPLKDQEITLCYRRSFKDAKADGASLCMQADTIHAITQVCANKQVRISFSGVTG